MVWNGTRAAHDPLQLTDDSHRHSPTGLPWAADGHFQTGADARVHSGTLSLSRVTHCEKLNGSNVIITERDSKKPFAAFASPLLSRLDLRVTRR